MWHGGLLHNLIRFNPAPCWQLDHVPHDRAHQDMAAFSDLHIVIDERTDVEDASHPKLHIATYNTMSANNTPWSNLSIGRNICCWVDEYRDVIPSILQHFRLEKPICIIAESHNRIRVILLVGWQA